ncbi:MAG: glycosyltransferase family 2 protein [Candidatus Aminicenantes bacterium]|nr:glycosyltransferase family 2 protein [Candidatus Aminicenantes bacterium]
MKYVLITVAWNEADFIEMTMKSVISQTTRPQKWIIVNDGSTDETEEIIKRYACNNRWIELISEPPHSDHGFSSKAKGFMKAYDRLRSINFDIIGNLDADITFSADYFEFLLDKFVQDPRLGVAGTPFVEDGKHYDYRFTSIEHVSGACQLFRRECFEAIGGYKPIKEGGIDWVAVTTARMMGWKTRTFTERVCFHHRKIGTVDRGILSSIFHYGKKNYYLGYHPLWQILRAMFQMAKKPVLIGGLALWLGYIWGFLTIRERPVSKELIKFYRKEQMARLKLIISNIIGLKKK